MNVNIRLAIALALCSLAASAMAQQGQLPNGGVPVGQTSGPAQPSAAQPSATQPSATQPNAAPVSPGGLAGLPAGAQPAPTLTGNQSVGAPIPQQSLPPLPSGGAEQFVPDFDSILAKSLGLTPDQLRELRRQQNQRQRAASELPMTAPKQVLGSVNASPAPGSVPPVVRLFPGYASALTFVDSTGALWPVENYAVGGEKLFDVRRMDNEKGSIFSIAPLGSYAQSNLVVYLRGLSSPIVITLVTGQKQVDLRTDVRVMGLGPNAQVAVGGLPASTNSVLYTLLEGVPPADAKELKVMGGDGRAWLTKNGRLYLRTSMKVISPAWIGSTRSADGTNAYEMMPANSIRVLRSGLIETVGIEGW